VVDLSDVPDAEIEALRQLAIRTARKQGADSPEDVAQDVLVKLTRLRSMPQNPEAWVTIVARRTAIDEYRRLDRRPQDVAEEAGEVRAAHEWLMNCVPVSLAGMQAHAYEWLWQRLHDLFSDREVELLSYVGTGMQYDEIAASMGYKNDSVVKTTLARIKKKVDALDKAEFTEMLGHPRMYGGGRIN